MKARVAMVVALAAGVTVTSVAAGGPTATKQRVNERYPDVSSPAWSPDGQKIAFQAWRPTASSWNASQEGWFSSLFEIRVVSADGSGQRVLVRDAGSLAWSPEGQRIAFDRDNDIHVVNADGSGQRRLTRDAATSFFQPVWSPDGQRMAFQGWREGETGTNPRIYVVGADGSGLRMLTQRGRQPAWSPDGQKIAFIGWRVGEARRPDIYVVGPDGSEQRVLVRDAGRFAWSPDGRMIAFGRAGTIYVVNADGSGQRRLTRDAATSFFQPVWSPDGQRIAFAGSRVGEAGSPPIHPPRIYAVGADGSGLRMLTRRAREPAWSPDGQKLLFVSDRDGLDAVYVMNADGSGQRRLTSPGPAIPMPVRCGFSHRNQDDPIVSPGQPGRSHDHTFFGNRSTDAFATPTVLRKDRRTTCSDPADTSAYWVPTLYVAGRAVEPLALIATYSRRTSRPLEPFPVGLKMIAGNAHAHRAQSSRVTFWSCAIPRAERSSTIPRCPGTRRGGLRLHVSFPDCWDGTRLDSADHKSHMAYSSRAACPRSHPVAVPALSLVVHYPVWGRRTAELASGGQFSGHADFLNAWNQAVLEGYVKRFLNRTRE